MEVRHDPAYRDSYTGDLLSGYCFYFRNAFTESIDADNTTPMFFLPDCYLDHEGEIDLPAEGTNCKWNLRFQYMYLSSYNGYGPLITGTGRLLRGSTQVQRIRNPPLCAL